MDLHSHRNAQLSAVFYVLTDPANESGEMEFEAPDDYSNHVMAIPYRDAAVSRGVFAPLPHSLLMFPSGLRHGCSLTRKAPLAIWFPTTRPSPRRQARDARCEHPIRWIGSPSAAKGSA